MKSRWSGIKRKRSGIILVFLLFFSGARFSHIYTIIYMENNFSREKVNCFTVDCYLIRTVSIFLTVVMGIVIPRATASPSTKTSVISLTRMPSLYAK